MGSKESGRSKYTPEVHDKIVQHLRGGSFKSHAALAAGISLHTLDTWIKWGREGREPYVSFMEDCDQAMAEDAVRNQLVITQAALGPIKGDWKAAAWNLERKHPKLYGHLAALETLQHNEKPYSPWKSEQQQASGEPKRFDA